MQKALEFAFHKHNRKFRKHFNIPYISHCLDVIKELSVFGIDSNSEMYKIGLLHDTLEDTDTTFDELNFNFGLNIAEAVQNLSWFKESNITKQQYLDSFVDKDIKLVIIKIADRICNVKDFILANDSYAEKYFHKARILFSLIENRKPEIINTFGEEIHNNINYEYHLLSHHFASAVIYKVLRPYKPKEKNHD